MKHTEATLRAFLINACDCQHLGKMYPRPYVSEIDMPDMYKCPRGRVFSVSEPDDGGHYSAYAVQSVISVYGLEPKSAWDTDTEES